MVSALEFPNTLKLFVSMWFGYILVAIRNGWNQQSGILQNLMELRGIDPRTSHMLSERSTIWATAPRAH